MPTTRTMKSAVLPPSRSPAKKVSLACRKYRSCPAMPLNAPVPMKLKASYATVPGLASNDGASRYRADHHPSKHVRLLCRPAHLRTTLARPNLLAHPDTSVRNHGSADSCPPRPGYRGGRQAPFPTLPRGQGAERVCRTSALGIPASNAGSSAQGAPTIRSERGSMKKPLAPTTPSGTSMRSSRGADRRMYRPASKARTPMIGVDVADCDHRRLRRPRTGGSKVPSTRAPPCTPTAELWVVVRTVAVAASSGKRPASLVRCLPFGRSSRLASEDICAIDL